jgi:Holliday junction resolvase
MTSRYQQGTQFEYRTKKDLERYGYSVVRSAGSHSPTDLIAMFDGMTYCIQCKKGGVLPPKEWNEFYDWCENAGARPILASKGPFGSGIIYHRLTSRKDGRGRQPLAPWEPQTKGE